MTAIRTEGFQIHNYDSAIASILKHISHELSEKNHEIIQKYDQVMVRESLAKATRRKHLEILLSIGRMLKKDWSDVTKDDVDDLVYRVMQKYSPETGRETNTTWDHKKVLKIFFRWLKLGSRSFRIVGDPDETKDVRLREVRSKIIREDLLTSDDIDRLLKSCKDNLSLVIKSSNSSPACVKPETVHKLLLRGWALNASVIDSFEECESAGNAVMESYPRQCQTPDGKHFVEEIN